jgi:hypothetical protein
MRNTWFVALFVVFILSATVTQAEEQTPAAPEVQKEWIRAVTPAENTEVIAKKPEVKADFLEPINSQTLVVMVDGTDVTQLLSVTEKGFEYQPVMVLSAGSHTISITVSDKEGKQLQKTISFTSRHSKTFEEAYTDNEASIIYEGVLDKPDSAKFIPDSRVEGNIRSDTKIKNKQWEFTFNTNLRYLDQNIPLSPPLKKGFDIANWLFTGSFSKEALKLKASVGDVLVNETQYTVYSLARKGGLFNFEYDNFQFNAFDVRSQQVFGIRNAEDVLGIGGTNEHHIFGVSGGVKLFQRRVEFKTIYVTGGEEGNSFNISTTSGAKKGDVLGFLLTSDFFENKMKTEFEAGFSDFDPDTSDEFKSKSDKAYKFKVGGFLGKYNYEAMYEYIGRDYAVVGNQMIQKDKEGVSLVNGLNFGVHAFNLTLSRYNDNVRGDDLFPRIVNYQGNLDYSFNGIPNLPIGVNYQKSVQDSTKEPSGSIPIEMHTDTVSGRINYTKDRFNLGAQTSYSLMNDKTASNNDTRTVTYTLTPSYNIPTASVSSAFSLNQSKIHLTGVRTDTYTINLDVRTKFFRDRGSFDVGSTYNIIKANDDSIDNRTLNANFRLAYNIKNLLKGYMNPTIALRGTYMKFTDKINRSADRDEFTMFLVLAATIPFSF